VIAIQITLKLEILGDAEVSNTTQPAHGNAQASTPGVRGEIQAKWGKFDEREIAALKDNDDLVAQLQTKYQLDRVQAQRDVDAFARGRQL
jgi:hypothetical protein